MKKVIVLVCVLSMLACGFAFAGCGGNGDSSSADSPKAVIEKLMQAQIDVDVDTYLSLLSKESRKEVDEDELREQAELAAQTEQDVDYEVGEEEISGDTAKVGVTMTVEDMEMTMTWNLVKEDGSWKVDMTKEPEINVEGLEDLENIEIPEGGETQGTVPESEPTE